MAVGPVPPAPRGGSPSREQLLAAVHARPGINKSALCAALGLAWGTVDYHLRVLVRDGHVTLRPEGRETRCFPGGLQPSHKALLSALADGSGQRIAFVLRHCPGQGIGALSQRLGLSSKVVRRRLVRMLEAGMLQRVGTYRPRYSLGSGVDSLFEEVVGQQPGEPGITLTERDPGPGEPVAPMAVVPALAASKTGK